MGDTDTSGALSVAGLPAHVRALLDEIRPAWEASGAARERETILAYLRLSGWLQVQRVADQVEAGLHTEYSEGLVYESRVAAATARAEAAEQRAEGLEREVARLRADCAILGDELSEANRLLLSGIPQQRGAKAERAAIACVLTGRAKTLRDRKALGAAEEVEALAFYIEQRGVAAEAQPAGEVSDG